MQYVGWSKIGEKCHWSSGIEGVGGGWLRDEIAGYIIIS
jgi:hypothetical protein